MAKPGPQPKSAALKVIQGTDRADREQGALFELDPTEVPDPPTWLKGMGLKLWHEKVGRYMARGQPVAGYEDHLAHFCDFEAGLIDKRKKKVPVPASAYSTLRAFANDFFDSPAANVGRGVPMKPSAGSSNPFTQLGKRPTAGGNK